MDSGKSATPESVTGTVYGCLAIKGSRSYVGRWQMTTITARINSAAQRLPSTGKWPESA